MDFDRLGKNTRKILIAALVVTIAFVAGIPGIVLSAVYGIPLLLAFCIACVGGGFYGMPFLWISYGNFVSLKRLMVAVDVENIYKVEDLASHLSKTPAEIREKLKYGIHKRYITDYLLVDDALVLNENRKQRKKIAGNQCRNCGAALVMTDNGLVCPYCGTLFVEDPEPKRN